MTAENNPEENDLSSRYKEKGFQKMSMEEYEAQRAKQSKRRKVRVPTSVKFVGNTFFMIIFCIGLVFIPWILWIIGTNPIKEKPADKTPIETPAE